CGPAQPGEQSTGAAALYARAGDALYCRRWSRLFAGGQSARRYWAALDARADGRRGRDNHHPEPSWRGNLCAGLLSLAPGSGWFAENNERGGVMSERISILIVDDHSVVRQGVRAFLEAQPDFAIAGEAESGEQAVQLAQELIPDVVLMDLALPGIDGVEAT